MAGKKLSLRAYLERLLAARPNDAVKLMFLDPAQADRIGRLDLSLLSEAKRAANGGMEIKLLDKTEILEKLAEIEERERSSVCGGANFYEALDRAARELTAVPETKAGDDDEV